MRFRHCLLLIMSLFSIGFAVAQETCPDIIQEALSTLDTNCFLTERNQACYGNLSLKAVPQRGVTEFKFDTIGDIANVADIYTLDLAPMDEAVQQWGLVMMRLQANIPDTLPGQNVTFLLFGDVTIQNLAEKGQHPMQSFYLTTGTGDAKCVEAPESGLMVQTPRGIKEVSFNVNGVDVEMGSTVIFQAEPGKRMRIITIEGKAKLKIGKKTVSVVQGSQYTAPVNDKLEITEPDQGEVAPYQAQDVQALPVTALERPITIHEPLTPIQIDDVKLRDQIHVPLCSDEVGSYLPPCKRPLVDAHGNEAPPTANGDVALVDETGAPRFYDEEGNPITTLDDYYRYLSYWTETPTLSDDFGNTINVSDDGTVAVVDPEGNTFTSTPEGTYSYTTAEGETYTADAPAAAGGFTMDATGEPVVIDQGGNVFPDENIRPSTDTPSSDPTATEVSPVNTTDSNPSGDAPSGDAPSGDAPAGDASGGDTSTGDPSGETSGETSDGDTSSDQSSPDDNTPPSDPLPEGTSNP
jgi:hypothetical protein